MVQQDIQLNGSGIEQQHCVVEVIDSGVFITPLSAARTLVNGKIIQKKTKLFHNNRVLLGANHFFQLSCPKENGMSCFVSVFPHAANLCFIQHGWLQHIQLSLHI